MTTPWPTAVSGVPDGGEDFDVLDPAAASVLTRYSALLALAAGLRSGP